MTQISMFDGNNRFKVEKPIRLIELFAGYGSQSLALEYLGVPFESWKICEWAVKSIQAYKDLHFTADTTDYSNGICIDEIRKFLFDKGISADYNQPMTSEQIHRISEEKAREIYNNIKATHNLVSICNATADDLDIIDTDKYTYIMTYSFPCTDLSLAGQQKGMAKDSGTRSSLLWEVERLLDSCNELPQVLIMENVPEVIGARNIKHFAKWLEKLDSLGYHSKWELMNAKDYGIPQNRNRCFMVSILGDNYYEFPSKGKLILELKDILEINASKKYDISEDSIKRMKINFNGNNEPTIYDIGQVKRENKAREYKKICPCLNARDYKDPKLVAEFVNYTELPIKLKDLLENNVDEKYYLSEKGLKYIEKRQGEWTQVLDKNSPIAISAITSKGNQNWTGNFIKEDNLKTQLCNKLIQENKVEEDDVIRHSYTKNRLNNGEKNMGRIESKDHLSPTLDTRCDCLGIVVKEPLHVYDLYNKKEINHDAIGTLTTGTARNGSGTFAVKQDNLRIRKLTPKECWRLMGVKDKDFEKVAKNQSNSSLYHLAGDSIVTTVLMAIFRQML